MTLVSLLNMLVVVVFTIAYFPQLRTTFQTKEVSGVSSFFWLLISLSTFYSLLNLLATGTGEFYVYLGQFMNAWIAAILFFWITKIRFGWGKSITYFALYAISSYSLYKLVPLEWSQTLATVAVILAYIDQIGYFIKHKVSDGTNPKLYFGFALGLAMLVVIMILTSVSWHVIFTEVINIIMLLVCGVLSIKYQDSKSINKIN